LEEGAIWVHERLEASAPLHVERGLSSELGREIASMARAVGIDLVEPQIVTDWQAIADQRLPLRPIMARFGIRASLSVPLLAEDRFIGALNLASSEPRPWTDEEIALMKAVGQQVGAAAERLRLLERTRAHDDLASRLASLSDSLNRLLSVEDVIAAIGQGVLALSNADRVAVYLCTAKDTIKGAWIHGLSPTYPDRVAKLIRKIPGGRTLKDLKPVFVSDVMALPQTSPARHLAQMEGFRAFAVWPLVYEGRTIAGIGCYYDAPHTWLEAEKEIMETFARQAAVALENARLYTSLQEANTQLQKALQAKNEMIQNVSHELRTPLTMIRGYSELLREGLLGRLLPQQKEAVETLHRNAERLHFMVHRLLTFQTLDPRACEKTRISPAIWLEDAVSNWQSQAQEANIRLTLDLPPDLPPIQGAPDLLDQVMDNLLDNAIKFSPHGGDVTVRAWMNGEELTVAVSDQGIGIPPDKLEEIFERFYQIDGSSTRRFGGMGIGLALCKRIVESHSGRIWAESEGVEGRGSTFYVALPVREKASMETTSAS
jgi:signal transduction histidine kinase